MAARHAAELAALEVASVRARRRTVLLLVASSLLAAVVLVLAIVGLGRPTEPAATPQSPAPTVTVAEAPVTLPVATASEPTASPQPSAKPKLPPIATAKPKPTSDVTVGSTSCARCSGVPLCTCKAGEK